MRRNSPASALAVGAVVATALCALRTPLGWPVWLPVLPALVVAVPLPGAGR